MIKTAIIFVLLILLAGGAFLSRPTKQGLEAFLREQSQRKDGPLAWFQFGEDDVSKYQFKDRLFWVEVEREGKTKFIGLFSKFFAVGSGNQNSTDKKNDAGKSVPFSFRGD